MVEWMKAAAMETPVHWGTLAFRLAVALVLGMLVAATYFKTRRAANVTPSFPATLVLLCVLIAMVTQVIGDNVARAFSLVGALSIVRFRTVVRDTKDTAFVIYAVAVGMSVGAGQVPVAVCGMAAVTLAALLFRDPAVGLSAQVPSMILVVRIALSSELDAAVQTVLAPHVEELELITASTVRHGSAMDVTYQLRLKPTVTLPQLVSELNRVEGVQSAEIRPERDED